MNFKVFNEIIQLNKDFYAEIGEEFSQTRQSAWPGWHKVLEILKKSGKLAGAFKVADLGCGNGRFLKFLLENKIEDLLTDLDYHGYDSDKYLIDLPQTHYDAGFFRFYNMDILSGVKKISDKFDLIVAFGLVHHIPSHEFRKQWFSDVTSLLKQDGIFIFTTWNYDRDSRFGNAVKSIPGKFNETDLEVGDYFVGWDKKPDTYRYVHIYSADEISEILNSSGLKLLGKFSADGKNGNLNDYYILQKLL